MPFARRAGGAGWGAVGGSDVTVLGVMAGRIGNANATWTVAQVLADATGGAEISFLEPYYKLNAVTAASVTALTGVSFARASSAVAANSSGVFTEFASGVPRVNDKGLRIEGASTNQVRNPRAEGASAGTPGTLPTNWSSSAAGGLAWNVVGSGKLNGLDYVDVRLSGTSTSTAAQNIIFDSGIAAAAADVWECGSYVALVAGSTTGLTSFGPVGSYTGGGTVNGTANAVTLLTSTLTRYSDALVAPASTTALSPRLRVVPTNGGVVDATFRIGWPQAMKQSFQSSAVLPTAGSPAAATRAADVTTWIAGVGLSASFRREFTLDTLVGSSGEDQTVAAWDDGTANNSVVASVLASTGHLHVVVTTGGVSQADLDLGAVVASTTYKLGVRLGANDIAACLNGGTVQTDTSATLPTVTTGRHGHQVGPAKFLYGYLRAEIDSTQSRDNATLQAWTA